METDAAAPAALPDDVLAAILGRLLARSLAASRCVCKAWRGLVDERGLLLRFRRLLLHPVSGIFINYVDTHKTHFFARPTPETAATGTGSTIDADITSLLPERHRRRSIGSYKMADHCNGLALYRGGNYGELYACNPATRRWVRLPQLAVPAVADRRAYLAFSPDVSRHYQVLVAPLDLVPLEQAEWRRNLVMEEQCPAGDAEWPPARWTWHVFSSRSGRWRERVFVRQGEAAGVVADLRMDSMCYAPGRRQWPYAVYRQGALYVHCRGEYVSRLSLSTGDYTYRVIKSPIDRSGYYISRYEQNKNVLSYLGGSNGKLYFVAINMRRLQVWLLNDHDLQQHDPTAGSEWILKHDRVLRPDAWYDLGPGPWILDYHYNRRKQRRSLGSRILDDYHKRRMERGKLDWSSDDDDDDIICNSNANGEPETFRFVGLHPYKEVIFLAARDAVVAYHLSTSKVQYLGVFRPPAWNGLSDSFVYTPCSDLRHCG